MPDPASIKAEILSELRALLQHQRQRRLRYRQAPTSVYHILDRVKGSGIDLGAVQGEWAVGAVPLGRSGRGGAPTVPCVECGGTRLCVETEERAHELAGLLNWCGVLEADVAPGGG